MLVEDEAGNEEIGKFNPPDIFHENVECKRMLVQMIKVFGILPSIAAFSLLATNFKSCDAALNFIAEDNLDGSENKQLEKRMIHPFIGCLALREESNATITEETKEALPPPMQDEEGKTQPTNSGNGNLLEVPEVEGAEDLEAGKTAS